MDVVVLGQYLLCFLHKFSAVRARVECGKEGASGNNNNRQRGRLSRATLVLAEEEGEEENGVMRKP